MIEKTILSNLILNEQYARKVLPFIKDEYFKDSSDRTIFDLIDKFCKKYNSFPTKEALIVDLTNKDDLTEDQYKVCEGIIKDLTVDKSTNSDWLVEQTEKFCQDQALFNAISKSIQLMNGDKGNLSKGSIPEILSEALSVSFDTHIGHDLIDDWESRFELYHTKENKIPFDLDFFNKITKGGLSKKTLNVCLAGCVHPETKIRIRYKRKPIEN